MCQYMINVCIFLLFQILLIGNSQASKIADLTHKTKEATEVRNDLYCHICSTMHPPNDGQEHKGFCENINQQSNNFTKKCDIDETFCIVTRFSYTTSTEYNTTERKLWSLQRNCTKTCKSGCIVIGERTKLYACSQCCIDSLCNVWTSGSTSLNQQSLRIGVLIILALHLNSKY